MRWSVTHGDVRDELQRQWFVRDADCLHRNVYSEIPCQVSSDLHEWRNDLGTVSTGDSAKLQYE